MKKKILNYLKYLSLTILVLLAVAITFGLSIGASVSYGDDPLAKNMDNEGPYVFYKNDSTLCVNYIKGNRNDGFYLTEKNYNVGMSFSLTCNNPFDVTSFDFLLKAGFKTPQHTYTDQQPILAISDIESNYQTFRNFLINSNVIDEHLNWTFGKGHLVLIGDMIDRGMFTNQVLWFIYKLEQDAEKQGGHVHFIIGNHELKMMHGNYYSSAYKQKNTASILGIQQYDLFSKDAYIGRWMGSKNAIELINGHLFVHGGIHPDFADHDWGLEEINQIIRDHYYEPYYPKIGNKPEAFIISKETGPCWYRGYFKDDLTQEEVEQGLHKFDANLVVVGHTIQSKVNRQFNGKVIGIDVRHPSDDHINWPKRESEALYIDGNVYYRVFDDGRKEEI